MALILAWLLGVPFTLIVMLFLLIDIGLPGLNGWDVATRLREAFGRSIGLIALTSLQSPADRARSLQAGFDVHLVKPATGEDLFRAIDALSTA